MAKNNFISSLLYADAWAGLKLIAQQGAQVRTDPAILGRGTVYNPNPGEYVICTGYFYYQEDGDVYFFQTTNDWWVIVNSDSQNDWYKGGTVTVRTYSDSQAQRLVNQIIENNKIILQNNLLCARYANLLTKEQQQEVRELQERLQRRNEALQAEGMVMDIETSYPAGYAELSAYLDKLMKGEQIGVVVSTWVVVVVAAVVVASMGTAAYFAYQAYAKESEQDVKFSKELTKTLTDKLTDEEYQQLLNETKGIVTKSRIRASVGTLGLTTKLVVAAIAAYLGYKWYKSNQA